MLFFCSRYGFWLNLNIFGFLGVNVCFGIAKVSSRLLRRNKVNTILFGIQTILVRGVGTKIAPKYKYEYFNYLAPGMLMQHVCGQQFSVS